MEIFGDYAAQILIYSIYAISLNILAGYLGQVSVAQAAFGAVGGYTAAVLSTNLGVPFWPTVLIGMLAAGLAGFVIGLPALNLAPDYLILLTLAASTMTVSIIGSSDLLGGERGLSGLELPELFGITLIRPTQWLPWLALVFVIVFALSTRVVTSGIGRLLKGIRENDTAARGLGKPVFRWKLVTFVVTSALAGLAGTLFVYYNTIAAPAMFSLDVSMLIFAMVIVGGRGNPFGALLGAVVLVALTPLLEEVVQLPPETASLVRLVLFGIGLVVLIRLRPQGILPEFRRRRARRAAAKAEVAAVVPEFQAADLDTLRSITERNRRGSTGHADGGTLEVRHLFKRFGGVTATNDLSFILPAKKITALVGPNGAGKTTVFSLITGGLRPDSGEVLYDGNDITYRSPDQVARAGIVRSYQDVKIFAGISALDNVRFAFPDQPGEQLFDVLFRPGRVRRAAAKEKADAMAWLEFVGLADKAEEPAGSLSFGDQRLITLARTIASGADVLLLDEPTSGMDTLWVDRMIDLITLLPSLGKTVCIVEHNLQVVERLSDHVLFMELGHVTASGTMAELTTDDRLTEVYFGTNVSA